MDELLQLDMSRPSQLGGHSVSHPLPSSHGQPSLLDEQPSKDSMTAWASPFAAWDSLVGVSPTESVGATPPASLCTLCTRPVPQRTHAVSSWLQELDNVRRVQATDEEKREAVSAEQSPSRHAGDASASAVCTRYTTPVISSILPVFTY